MGKTSVQRKKPAPVAVDEIDKSLAVLAARKTFVSTAANMGWQLAITVLVPLVIGVKLDNYYNTTPSYTLAALIIAISMAVMVVAKTIKQVNVKVGKSQ